MLVVLTVGGVCWSWRSDKCGEKERKRRRRIGGLTATNAHGIKGTKEEVNKKKTKAKANEKEKETRKK